MVGANHIILDQIANDNNDNSTPLVNYEHNNTQNDGGDWQRRWVVAFDSSVGSKAAVVKIFSGSGCGG
jgi:hypothetical protein